MYQICEKWLFLKRASGHPVLTVLMSPWRQVVTTNTAQRWADDRGMPLFETSAKDDSLADHVDGIFLTLAHKLKEGKTLIEQVPRSAALF